MTRLKVLSWRVRRGRAHALSQRRSDLWIVASATLLCFIVSSRLELQESFFRRLASLERWQADELPFTLTVFALGLAWYGWRRRREARVELTLRKLAETQVGELLAHNRELAQRLIAAQESERLFLARELHDELGQRCTAIRAETAFIRHCAPDDHAGVIAAAARADAAAASLYAGVRDLLKRLRPANLDALGLVAAVQELCASWAEQTGLHCTFAPPHNAAWALDDAAEVAVYRVAQEALTNIARHARASAAHVELGAGAAAGRPDPPHLMLTVSDDGCGMDPSMSTHGLGLLGASERAAALGGTLALESALGRGVRLRLVLPARRAGAVGDPTDAADPGVSPDRKRP